MRGRSLNPLPSYDCPPHLCSGEYLCCFSIGWGSRWPVNTTAPDYPRERAHPRSSEDLAYPQPTTTPRLIPQQIRILIISPKHRAIIAGHTSSTKPPAAEGVKGKNRGAISDRRSRSRAGTSAAQATGGPQHKSSSGIRGVCGEKPMARLTPPRLGPVCFVPPMKGERMADSSLAFQGCPRKITRHGESAAARPSCSLRV